MRTPRSMTAAHHAFTFAVLFIISMFTHEHVHLHEDRQADKRRPVVVAAS